MKKFILYIVSLAIITGLFFTFAKKQDIREISFNQIPAVNTTINKDRIEGTWKDGKLFKKILSEDMGTIYDKSYIGKSVYVIDFPTKKVTGYTVLPDKISIIIAKDTYKLIGYYDVRGIVFNKLPQERREQIKGTWEDARASTVTFRITDMANLHENAKSYIGKEVYLVDFLVNHEWMPNNMLVVATKDNCTILGYPGLD